ncbi:MAG: type II toxin-antitoxin system RelB/DinJ family antitoxin [Clostridia bacterium]|nr:type II toxin-antitoxin system RelB/DinJ family antitoxin [Clostridia bacterium]
MAGTLVQFRLDEGVKNEASFICSEIGIDLQTYLKLCVSRLISSNGIPFSMNNVDSGNNMMSIVMRSGMRSALNGNADMTLDEINAEITEARKARLK